MFRSARGALVAAVSAAALALAAAPAAADLDPVDDTWGPENAETTGSALDFTGAMLTEFVGVGR